MPPTRCSLSVRGEDAGGVAVGRLENHAVPATPGAPPPARTMAPQPAAPRRED
jgi:hypothetical protein